MPKLELKARIVMICTTSRTPFAPVFLTIRASRHMGPHAPHACTRCFGEVKLPRFGIFPFGPKISPALRIVPNLKNKRKE